MTADLSSLQTDDETATTRAAAAVTRPFEVTRGAYLKRNKETITIEGSPLVKTKRRDLRPTPPQGFRQQRVAVIEDDQRRGGGGEKMKTIPKRAGGVRERGRRGGGRLDEAEEEGKRVVQVLSFHSQDHNTQDHQENIRRTVLLTGPKGCLRRPEMREFLRWIDDSKIPPIQLGDLLRSLSLPLPLSHNGQGS
jgi:hypothetical protein